MSAITKNITKVPLIFRVVPLYVVTAGVLWAGHFLFVHTQQPVSSTQPIVNRSTTVGSTEHIISGEPTRITVDRLGIDLVVKDGYYENSTKEWTLSDNATYFAAMTTPPNDSHGNTFIYGHNTSTIFAPLKDISVGDIVNVYTSNGHIFRYTYRADAVVTPDITNVLYEDPASPQLTIMTCEGIWSKVRRIMYFDFKEVS
jgi:LPXTG-site transpeptidase (sortase) family protein